MNDEYVRNLLREEMGYYPTVRFVSPSGNDVYGKLYYIRLKSVDDLQDQLYELNDLLQHTTDPDKLTIYAYQISSIERRLNKISPFGYDSIKYDGRYPLLEEQHENLKERFLIKYYDYRIGYNTMEMFDARLRNLFEDIAPLYENKLLMLNLYKKEISKENLSLDDISSTDSSNTSSFFNEQDPEESHKSSQYDSRSISASSDLSAKIKNITAGNNVYQSVLKDYLNEFRVLFINVWGDETEGFI